MVELKGVSKKFDTILFEDFNIIFEKGKTTVLLGNSGCGKTALINILLGFLKPDKGYADLGGAERVSVVFQENRLINSINVLNNLLCVNNDDKLCKEVLEKLNLKDSLLKYPEELSGGMKRRVALARAIVYGGDLFIMDEPFNGIDIILKERLMPMVKSVLHGKTAVLITHEIQEAVNMGDNIVILGGRPMKILKIIENKNNVNDVSYIENLLKNTECDF